MNASIAKIQVVDSHTGGEPTRVVIDGGPELGDGSVAEQMIVFRDQYDFVRRAIVNEPRGSDVLVGAMLVKPKNPNCIAGVIFFDNVKFIGMCGQSSSFTRHFGRNFGCDGSCIRTFYSRNSFYIRCLCRRDSLQ